jgi:hypothetical protein
MPPATPPTVSRRLAELLLLAVLILAGCATPVGREQVQFVSFEEPQQTWPTQRWGILHVVDGFPIYALNQLPPEPYDVKGFVYATPDRGEPPEKLERAVVATARAEQAEGAIVTKSRAPANRLDSGATEYLVIQFKTNALAAVLERINIYMTLQTQPTNSSESDSELQREQLEALRQAILRHDKPR